MTQHWSRQKSLALVPITTAYEMFRLDMQSRRCTQATLDFYRWRLQRFRVWCDEQGIGALQEITPTLIRTYLVGLQEKNLSDYSQLDAARAVRAFCKFCVREGLLDVSPCDKVRMPDVDDRILPAFSEDDIKELLAHAADERDKTIILALLDTGLRAFELLNLDAGDIDLANGSIRVRKGKGKKDRMVYLGAKARKQMRKYLLGRGELQEGDPVFVSLGNDGRGQNRRLGRSGLFQNLRRLGREAAVKHCAPHTFRRTFALWSLRNGMDICTLARLMGHKDITVLQRYLALVEGDLRAAHERYGTVDNMLSGGRSRVRNGDRA